MQNLRKRVCEFNEAAGYLDEIRRQQREAAEEEGEEKGKKKET